MPKNGVVEKSKISDQHLVHLLWRRSEATKKRGTEGRWERSDSEAGRRPVRASEER